MIGEDGFGGADGFAANETRPSIVVLQFRRVSDVGNTYVTSTQRVAELRHLGAWRLVV
jgi:hypothetical protein